jgi:hypothetical protein
MAFTRKVRSSLPGRNRERFWPSKTLRIASDEELIMAKPKRAASTYEREMEDPKFRKRFATEYAELALSELILALMEEDDVSVRKLAKQVGLAPSVVQSVRSGKHSNLTLKTFVKMVSALGAELAVKKGRHYIAVKIAA